MIFLQELAKYIQDNTTYKRNVDIFLSKQPDRTKKVNCITLYQTGGLESTGEISAIMDITVQIIIRNTKYADGEAIGKELRDLLHGKNKYDLTSYHVLYSQAIQDFPAHIGQDENGNDEFSINFHLKIR